MTTLTIPSGELQEAAVWASRLTPTRPTTPILGGLLLDADDELRLTGWDFETCGTVTIPAVVKEPGRLLVSARLLAAIAKTIGKDEDVVIEDDRGEATVRCGRAEWSLPTMPAHDYPDLPKVGEAVATVQAAILRRALARILPAVSHNASPPALAGVRIEPSGTGLTLAATDRWRLAAADIPLVSGEAFEALVPPELLEAAVRGGAEGDVQLACSDGLFGLVTAAHRVVGRQIAEEYPPWRTLVPEPGEHHAIVDVEDLAQAVTQAHVMSEDDDAAIRLTFADDAVQVAPSGEGRRAQADAPASLHGEPTTVQVKAAYLRAALAAMDSETCTLHFYRTFVILQPCEADGTLIPGYRHLVMHRRKP